MAKFVLYSDEDLQRQHRELFEKSIDFPIEPVLPPKVTAAEFEWAIKEWRKNLGVANVITGSSLFNFIDPFEMMEIDKKSIPSAAICPGSVEELREALKVANQKAIPLWTCSRGKNLGYGGPAPRMRGSVVLSLHRMNKIIEVNEKYAYAVVEPGVTFFDLYNHCRSNNLKLWPSVPSLGWGSVLGNTVDRGFGYTPLGDHHQHMCGLEVMFANGDLLRTGQYAISHGKTAHLCKYSFGPSTEGLFLQSNLGIVTKLGLWLYPQPQTFISCTVDMDDPEDIEAIVDVLGELRRRDILQNNPVIRNIIAWSSMQGRREDVWDGEGPIPQSILKKLQKKMDLGYWMVRFGLYGPKDVVEKRLDVVKSVMSQQAPTARLRSYLFEGDDGGLVDATKIPTPLGGGQVGVPDMWTLPAVQYRCPKAAGLGAHTDFSPILPASGKVVLEWFLVAKKIIEAEGFDAYCGGHLHARHMVLINMILFDKSNANQRAAVQTIFQNLVRESKKRGFSKYRSHINDMDAVADMYDFNNHAYRRFIEGLKDSLDPNGILSPGKQGIWPKRYRVEQQTKLKL